MEAYNHIKAELERYLPKIERNVNEGIKGLQDYHDALDERDKFYWRKFDSFKLQAKDPLDYVLIETIDDETMECRLIWRKKS